ncbi:MAG: GTPase [Gemmataceae bacterium]
MRRSITILGQVKAGKSSLINALLGEQRARTGVVPTTDGVERYELLTPGVPTRLVLNDTVGYAHSTARVPTRCATGEAAKQSTCCSWCCTPAIRAGRPTWKCSPSSPPGSPPARS